MLRSKINKILTRVERPYEVYNRIEVSRAALLHNVDLFKAATNMQIIPVLKGNAYGHGIEQVATALKDRKFPYIAVDGYFEALKVRAHNRNPILVMGMIKPHNFSQLRLTGLTFVVQDKATIQALGGLNKKIKIHLEINTGMNRYGILHSEIVDFLLLIKKYPKLQLEGVMSHLADSDAKDDANIKQAVSLFDEAVETILKAGFKPKYFHVAQSAGSVRAKSRHANAIRLGLGLYGISPFAVADSPARSNAGLKPALKLISTISKIQHLNKGYKVSYGYTFTAPKAMQIGVLPLGYHEGLNRNLSNIPPIVGRVCMNHTMISLDSTDAKVGDEVVVYSDNPDDPNSINKIVTTHGEFAYTLLTDLSPDVRRYLVE